MVLRETGNNAYARFWVASYLLLNTIFHWLCSVVLPIVFCAKSIVTFFRPIVLLANPEARSMRYDRTQKFGGVNKEYYGIFDTGSLPRMSNT